MSVSRHRLTPGAVHLPTVRARLRLESRANQAADILPDQGLERSHALSASLVGAWAFRVPEQCLTNPVKILASRRIAMRVLTRWQIHSLPALIDSGH